jgi:hypothetical protein
VKSDGPVTIPHVAYNENDLWVLSSALTPYSSHSLLLCSAYGKGSFYVLTIPDAPADFYKLPEQTLTAIRSELNLPVTLECVGRVSQFLYDNNTFILQSFLDRPERVRVRVNKGGASLVPLAKLMLRNIPVERVRAGENESVFEVYLMPGHYAMFKVE